MYQIYIPNVTGPLVDHLVAAGLGDILDPNNPPAGTLAPQGPDGASGMVFYWSPPPRPPGYRPEQQVWTACKARKDLHAGRVWLGRSGGQKSEVGDQKSDLRPPISDLDPASIARRTQLPGIPVRLADGQEWLVPTALRLPKRWTLGDDGEGKPAVQDRYRAFYSRCETMFNWFRNYSPGEHDVTIPGGFSLAVEALSLNYRLNADLIDWLGLFTDAALVAVLGATFEWETLKEIEHQKKTADSPIVATTPT
jgi:hypothetical protein